ncbi:EAL domain-containing protein [Legionella sp. D16C41]|uniref:EAL domain-containing protein n=1 Tax=Legionella sp. D16C41 TaxID=3402688 RepID=UPI003AF70DCB
MINKKEIYWSQLIEALAQGVVIIDKSGIILYANEAAASLFGFAPSDLIGMYFTHPLSANETQEIEIYKSNGKLLIAQMTVKRGAWQGQFAWIVSLVDISELKKKDKLLNITSKGVNAASEGIVITDEKGIIIQANQAFFKLTGFSEQEVLGRNPNIFHSGKQTRDFYENLWSILLRQGYWSGELTGKEKHNNKALVLTTLSSVQDENGDITNYICFFHDLTLIKDQEKQLKRAKYYDVVTGLPNKFFLTHYLERYINKAPLGKKNLIVFSIRLFGSSKNSAYGTDLPTRDKIILQVVERIRRSAKQINFLARIGYNEFIILYLTHQNLESFSSTAKQTIKMLTKPYKVSEKSYKIYCVIGITAYTKEAAFSAEELLHQAEIARHKARQVGVNKFDFFDPQVEIETLEFNKYIQSIQKAIRLNQLKLYYQPKVNFQTGQVIGFEALLRWEHPERGLLNASQFLFHIDYHPISLELGHWVIHQALQQAEVLISYNLDIPISLNVSSYQLQDKEFIKKLDAVLAHYPNVPSKMIMLEILETEAIADLELVSKVIRECQTRGIIFSLDDFGTSYSSLTYLKELDVVEIKLDRSFIQDTLIKPQALAILKPTIDLCRVMGRELVAEGVETLLHAKLLSYLGCNKIQGFAIAQAMPADKLIDWLRNWKLDPSWRKNKLSKKIINELLIIAINHYMEFQTIPRYLKDKTILLPNLNLSACAIDKWLLKYKQRLNPKAFNQLYKLHEKYHKLANKIVDLANLNEYEEAHHALEKFEALRRLLLHHLIQTIFID